MGTGRAALRQDGCCSTPVEGGGRDPAAQHFAGTARGSPTGGRDAPGWGLYDAGVGDASGGEGARRLQDPSWAPGLGSRLEEGAATGCRDWGRESELDAGLGPWG